MTVQANITRSIYAVALQGAMVLDIPYVIRDNTTLNEKFNVLPDASIPEGEYPITKYVTIGRGGHRSVTGADNSSLTALNKHRASDAALFNHMPFVLREIEDDLTVAERLKYGLRVLETHDGVDYVAYYLRRMDHTGLEPQLTRVTVTDGEQTVVPYVPSSVDLSPTPVEIDPVGVTESNGEYLAASVIIEFELTTADIAEIVAANVIKYGSELYATLSEIGLCSGFDLVTEAQNVGQEAFNYKEAIGVQVNTTICTHYNLHHLNSGLTLTYELGGSESMSIS